MVSKVLTVRSQEYQLGGDIIVAIDDQPVRDMDDLISYKVEKTHQGDGVMLDVIRPDREKETATVTLGVWPRPNAGHEYNE